MLNINIIPCLQDNYSYIIQNSDTNTVGVIDPSEFKPVDNFIQNNFYKYQSIKHWDIFLNK